MAKKRKAHCAIAIVFVLIFFALAMHSCATPYYYNLSEDELARLKLEAVMGDGKAAARVVDYYLFTKGDHNNEYVWTLIGAENGDTLMMEHLSSIYLGASGKVYENFTRAIFWLYQLAIYDYEETDNHWKAETFIERLEREGYTLETAKPPSDALFPSMQTLTPSGTARYKKGALQGSGQAVLVLANYLITTGDAEEAEYWYRIGAQNGDREFMRKYGSLLLWKEETLDQERGKFWLGRGNGDN